MASLSVANLKAKIKTKSNPLIAKDTVVKQMVVFALDANFLNSAPVLLASCIVLQAWSTMKIPLGLLTKFQVD